MTLPYLSTTIRDPGLPRVTPTDNVALVMGICSSGTAATVTTLNSVSDLVTNFGYGPAVEVAAAILTYGGGPLRFVKIAQSAAGAVVTTPFTESGTGPDVTDNSSTPYDAYDIKIKITLAGAVATSRFQYSLDGGRTYSPSITTAATYNIPNSGVSIAFAVGSYVLGDIYSSTTTAPVYTATEMDAAFAALKLAPLSWDFGVLAGKHADAATANTIFTALSGDRGALPEPYKNKPWVMDAGAGNKATTISGLAATDRWINLCYGTVDMVSSCPVTGRTSPALPLYVEGAIKASTELISTHWGRTASGTLVGAAAWSTQFGSPLSFDEYFDEGLDEYGITTARTVPGLIGYYLTRGRMKAPVGSDFQQWHHARIFAEAHRIVHAREQAALNRSWAVRSNGTLVEDEAAAFEAVVNAELKAVLHQRNAEGTIGHVSIDGDDPGFFYRLDRSQNVLATSQVVSEWGIRPRGYSEYITATGGFTAQTTTA